MKTRNWLVAVLTLAAATNAAAQDRHTLGFSPTVQYYSFDEKIGGATSAMLALMPIGYDLRLSRSVSIDLYSAYAHGVVELGDKTHTMSGIVDTRIRASVAVTPWAVVTGAVNLPTGNPTHDTEEAVVATALSTELLGFREALWGTGFGVTTGVATAWRAGSTGIGLGASYRVASEFEPSADDDFKYTPGNETRVRVALDRNFGTSKLTLGGTFQNYTDDRVDGRDLFAPGNRWRADLSYSFRSGATSTWTLFATDVWRENGDVSLQIDNGTDALRDTVFQAGQQNMIVVGFAGATRSIRPAADFRLMTRESGEDEGWLGSLGFDLPMRRGRTAIIPLVRASYGQLEGSTDERHPFWGGELSLTVRWGGGR